MKWAFSSCSFIVRLEQQLHLKARGSLCLLVPKILVQNSPLTGFSSGGDVSLVVWPSGSFFRFSELFVFLLSFAGSFMTCSLFVSTGIHMPMSSWLVVGAVVLFPVVLVSFSEEPLSLLLDATFLLLLLGATLLWEYAKIKTKQRIRSRSELYTGYQMRTSLYFYLVGHFGRSFGQYHQQ